MRNFFGMGCMRLLIILFAFGGSQANPLMAASTIACILDLQDSPGSVCTDKTSSPPPSVAFIDRVANAFNYNIGQCDRHPNPDHARAFMLPSPLSPKVLHVPCNLGPGMDMSVVGPPSGCSGDAEINVLKQCTLAWSTEAKPIKFGDELTVIVFNFPEKSCGPYWAGLGTQGGYFKYVLLASGFNLEPPGSLAMSLLHEIGHTFGLRHASVIPGGNTYAEGISNYGDCSCQLGDCAGGAYTCYNVVNSNALGFATSLLAPLVPDGSNEWRVYTIPVFSTAFKNHIVIAPSAPGSIDLIAVFLSVRSVHGRKDIIDNTTTLSNLGYSAVNLQSKPILGGVEGKLSIHKSSGRGSSSLLLDAIGPSVVNWDSNAQTQAKWFAGNPFVLRHVAYVQGVSSTVWICFYTGSPANCKTNTNTQTIEHFKAENMSSSSLRRRRSGLQFSQFTSAGGPLYIGIT